MRRDGESREDEVLVREAGEGDAVALARLAHDLGYEVTADQVRLRLPSSAGGPAGAVFLAEDLAGAALGWIQVNPRTILVDHAAELGGLIVAPGRRRRGVGAALLAAVEDWAARNGFDRVRVRTNVRREDAPGFYEASGYTREKTQHVFVKRIERR